MFCTKCGNEVADGLKFCPNCGAELGTSGASGQNNSDILSRIIRYFPLNKGVKSKDIKSVLFRIGFYLAGFIVLSIVAFMFKKTLLVGNLLGNLKKLYRLYALAGSVLGLVQCYGKSDYSEVNYINADEISKLFLNDAKKISWIVAGAIIVVMCLWPAGGYKSTKMYQKKQLAKYEKQLEKENKNKSDEEETDTSVNTEEVEKEEAAEEKAEATVDYEALTKDFYEIAKGYWSNDDITYGFIRSNNRLFFLHSGDRESVHSTKDPYYEYVVTSLETSGDVVNAVLADDQDRLYDAEITMVSNKPQNMKFRRQDEEWIALANTTITSMDELANMDSYVAPYLGRVYDDKYGKDEYDFYIINEKFSKDNYLLAYIDCFDEVEGEFMTEPSYNKGSATIWGLKDGFMQPLCDVCTLKKDIFYDPTDKKIWGWWDDGPQHYQTYFYSYYDSDDDLWFQHHIFWDEFDENDKDVIQFIAPGEDYEAALAEYAEEKAEAQKQRELTKIPSWDECKPITKSLEEYAGTFYQGSSAKINIHGVTDDVMTVTSQDDDNFSIMGALPRQIGGDYPDDVRAYGGTIKASGRNGHTGSFSGQFVVILMPDGDVFVHHVSGDKFFMEGYHSKEQAKY